MPTYDYGCQKCGYQWSVMKSFGEHEKQPKPHCPKCRSKQVQQRITSFVAVTPKKT